MKFFHVQGRDKGSKSSLSLYETTEKKLEFSGAFLRFEPKAFFMVRQFDPEEFIRRCEKVIIVFQSLLQDFCFDRWLYALVLLIIEILKVKNLKKALYKC